MKNYLGSSEEVLISLSDKEFSTPIWTPLVGLITPFATRNDFYEISNYERRIETNTKLSYYIALTLLNLLYELSRTTTSNGSKIGDKFFPWHTYSIVLNDDLFLFRMNLDIHMKVFTRLRGKSLFLKGIRGIRE